MIKRIGFSVFIIFTSILLLGASVWEGAAAAGTSRDLPERGFYAATSSFPRNTVVEITNLENNKKVQAIVSGGLENPGLLALVSQEAAAAIGLESKSVGRIRMNQSADPLAFARLAEGKGNSGDPDFDPKAFVAGNTPKAERPEAKVSETPAPALAPEKARTERPRTAAAPASAAALSPAAPAPASAPAAKAPPVPVQAVPAKAAAPSWDDFPLQEPGISGVLMPSSLSKPEESARDDTPSIVDLPDVEGTGGWMERPEVSMPPESPEGPSFSPSAAPASPPVMPTPVAAPAPSAPPAPASETASAKPAATPAAAQAPARQSQSPASSVTPPPAASPVKPAAAAPAASAPSSRPKTPVIPAGGASGYDLSLVPAGERPPQASSAKAPKSAPAFPEESPEAAAPSRVAPEGSSIPSFALIEAAPPEEASATAAVKAPSSEGVLLLGEGAGQSPAAAAPVKPPAAAVNFSAPVITELEKGKFYVQLAALSKADRVEAALTRLRFAESLPLAVQPGGTSAQPLYRILVGPLNPGESAPILQRFKASGYQDAFVRNK